MKESLMIPSGNASLEATADIRKGSKGVVITHPHPLYGGDMDNPVVSAIETAYGNKGFSTLKFNFRGVGRSSGQFDNGKGEAEDVCAALDFLRSSGISDLYISGYSFGTWVNASADLRPFDIRHMTMVSPPVAFMEFSNLKPSTIPAGAVSGTRDDIAPPAAVETWLKTWNQEAILSVIDGADHFYSVYTDMLITVLTAMIDSLSDA